MNHASGSDAIRSTSARRRGALWRALGVAATAATLLVGAAVPAAAAEMMRVTFVRHGQSAGNASGLIDTSTPGPNLTATGQQQSQAVVGTLGHNNYDAIYASTMVRTQLTAGPMSKYLGLPIQVLPGLQEIEAGVFEGTPESEAANGYGLFPLAWAIQGDRNRRIPQSIDGNEFDARVDGALQTIYDNGDRNPVIFSHGGTIMFWTMMNAQNLTAAQKIDLLRTAPLSNTHYVVVEGNPEDGWTLVNWNGKLFSPEPTLGAEVKRQLRTLNRQIITAANQFFESFASRDIVTIATAFTRSVADAAFAISKYHRAIQAKIASEVSTKLERSPAQRPSTLADVDAGPAALVSPPTEPGSVDQVTPVRTSAPDTERSDAPLSVVTEGAAVRPEAGTVTVADDTVHDDSSAAVTNEQDSDDTADSTKDTADSTKSERSSMKFDRDARKSDRAGMKLDRDTKKSDRAGTKLDRDTKKSDREATKADRDSDRGGESKDKAA